MRVKIAMHFAQMIMLATLVTTSFGMTLPCDLLSCTGPKDVSDYSQVRCYASTSTPGGTNPCTGVHTWANNSLTSLSYECTENASLGISGQAFGCKGLRLQVTSTSVSSITIHCRTPNACDGMMVNVNASQSWLRITCEWGSNCKHIEVVGDGNILMTCNGVQSDPFGTPVNQALSGYGCQDANLRNTGASDKTLRVDCVSTYACGHPGHQHTERVPPPGIAFDLSHPKNQPVVTGTMPTNAQHLSNPPIQNVAAAIRGVITFGADSQAGLVTCSSPMDSQSSLLGCIYVLVQGKVARVDCLGMWFTSFGSQSGRLPACLDVEARATYSVPSVTVNCRSTYSESPACGGSMTVENQFGDATFKCDGVTHGSNLACKFQSFFGSDQRTILWQRAAPNGKNVLVCPAGNDCASVDRTCNPSSAQCLCVGTPTSCARFPNPPSSAPTRRPNHNPSRMPTKTPSKTPSRLPSTTPSRHPSNGPSARPTRRPSNVPTQSPTRPRTQIGDKIYFASQTWLSFDEAQKWCFSHGGILASIKSEAENNAVFDLSVSVHGNAAYWIGLRDVGCGSKTRNWRWQDGTSAAFTKWAWGEPNDWASNEDCGEVSPGWAGKYWNDLSCKATRVFICEYFPGRSSSLTGSASPAEQVTASATKEPTLFVVLMSVAIAWALVASFLVARQKNFCGCDRISNMTPNWCRTQNASADPKNANVMSDPIQVIDESASEGGL